MVCYAVDYGCPEVLSIGWSMWIQTLGSARLSAYGTKPTGPEDEERTNSY